MRRLIKNANTSTVRKHKVTCVWLVLFKEMVREVVLG